jgi:hypothetical protein
MARYLSLHTLACLTRQGAEQLTARLRAATEVTVRRAQVNLVEGKMLIEFEAAERAALEKWLATEGFHFDWVMRVQYELREQKLLPVD